ncbi:DUF3868 domain-containing protein [Dysgonomonas sp. HDW5A]|uniref:DUF3868 domain-containing protein n=1 Tax=Dysgonomonas sp. HDW5A TaxID=2714926 RepID=UPI00140CB7EA|nr:DUF3868 domain-containing protein [Dysgonomonas sp. HDW5A]QIK58567.1 DUF3868 domain-containing protein [Dysgonomonas sp. HDW5A]
MPISRHIYILAFLLIYGYNTGYSQEKYDNISFEVKKFTQEGDSLRIDVDFNFSNLQLSSREQLVITPVIKNSDRELDLKPLLINGKIRHKVYLRQKAFGTLDDINKKGLEVIKKSKQGNQIISYSTAVYLDEWMRKSDLYIQESSCPGCGKAISKNERLVAQNPTLETIEPLNQENIEPAVTFIIPEADSIKKRYKQGSAYLTFEVGKSVINTSIADNAAELAIIHATLEELTSDKNVSIQDISIIGFASIEGTANFNKQLSEKRAKSLQTYIQQKYSLPYSLFDVSWVGEDWDGLVTLIQSGNMDKKQEVLAIINDTEILDGREKKLMQLDGGQPYRFMLNTYFPLLRRVNYVINYTLPPFSLEESKQIIRKHPDQLSRRELFVLADSYGKGSPEFSEILEIALNVYPDDTITRKNAAASYIMQGKYNKAEKLLSNTKPVRNQETLYNSIIQNNENNNLKQDQ